jgi:hypothetical protein
MGCRLVWEEVDLLVLRKAATGLVNIAWRSARYEFTDNCTDAPGISEMLFTIVD